MLPKPLILVGLMGAGKSAIGRRVAARLDVPFIDADVEIEKAAGCSIADIFARDGEEGFRAGERRVVARLLNTEPVHVLATGGGAFMDPDTRALIMDKGISLWLRADLDVLFERVSRRSHRPLLKTADPK
ncbi:MAG: shikimate kinase, partial [Alphaproteobacteria bacterium]|nr:shikimate kinase [Alphaproteobacteria bacterium]